MKPARLEEPQKLGPFGFGLSSNSVGFGLRAPGVGRRPSAQARRLYEPHKQRLFLSSSALSPDRDEACGAQSNVSCGPPRWEASGPHAPKGRKSNNAQSTAKNSAQFCRVLPRRASPHRCLRALRSGSLYPNKRPAILRIALITLDLQQFAASGEQQRAPTSCSPPQGVAANCAALRAARAQPQSKPHTQPSAAQSSPHFSALCAHCGSAIAPPRFRAPCAIHSISAYCRNS